VSLRVGIAHGVAPWARHASVDGRIVPDLRRSIIVRLVLGDRLEAILRVPLQLGDPALHALVIQPSCVAFELCLVLTEYLGRVLVRLVTFLLAVTVRSCG